MARDDDRLSLLEGKTFWESHAAPELGLRSLFFSDGPHGVRRPRSGAASGIGNALPATCFPTASALAASWDRELVYEVGAAIGREARALGVDVVLGPGLNIKRSPLCGRNFEYFSEDPRLAGELAAAMVRGIQSNGVGACLKHFAVNNQEDHRMVVDAIVDERTLREIYLRAFEIAVTKGAPFVVMGAYNRINGTFACENELLLGRILRREWGFDGLVISDWGAVSDCAASVAAGLDLAMPTMRGAHASAVREGLRERRVERASVDASIARLVALSKRTDAARSKSADAKASGFDERAHHAIARRAAARCCVLLRNEDGLLPIDPGASTTIAVVGALAKTPRYQGAGSSGVVPTRLTNVHDALAGALGDRVRYAAGYRLDDRPDPALIAEAVAVARAAGVVVVVAGLPPVYESEAFDRQHMDLPRVQTALLAAIAEACPRVAVVVCNGAPIAMPWADRVSAVVEAYLGGQAAGEAIADVLTGAVNPSGKLAETFARSLGDHASTRWFPGDAQHVEYREAIFVGYRWFDTAKIDVRFPFGHGLSYTTFSLSDLTVRPAGDDVEVDVSVENTGSRRGAEVVQVYVHDVEHTVVRPEHELAAFERVTLAPGERRRITLRIERRAFAFWDVRAHRWAVEPGTFEIRVGASSRDIRLRASIEVDSRDGPFAHDMPAPYREPKAPLRIDDATFVTLLGRPLPQKRPLRPFTRETTLGQLRATRIGAALYRNARAQAKKDLEHGDDPALAKFAEAMITELPLRAIITLSAKMRWRQLDALVDALDGRPLSALRRLARRR